MPPCAYIARYPMVANKAAAVVCSLWQGSNTNSRLGDGTTATRLVPFKIDNSTDWATVVTGTTSTCALKYNGSLYCCKWALLQMGVLPGHLEAQHPPTLAMHPHASRGPEHRRHPRRQHYHDQVHPHPRLNGAHLFTGRPGQRRNVRAARPPGRRGDHAAAAPRPSRLHCSQLLGRQHVWPVGEWRDHGLQLPRQHQHRALDGNLGGGVFGLRDLHRHPRALLLGLRVQRQHRRRVFCCSVLSHTGLRRRAVAVGVRSNFLHVWHPILRRQPLVLGARPGMQLHRPTGASPVWEGCTLSPAQLPSAQGTNTNGQLGIGNTTQMRVPTAVAAASSWAALPGGGGGGQSFMCAIKSDNTLWCSVSPPRGVCVGLGDRGPSCKGWTLCLPPPWRRLQGLNTANQLGDGTTTQQTSPTAVLGSGLWTSVTLGLNHVCGIQHTTRLYCHVRGAVGHTGRSLAAAARCTATPPASPAPPAHRTLPTVPPCRATTAMGSSGLRRK